MNIPEGYKLVPVEPTPEMKNAGFREHLKNPTNANPCHKYSAMLAAAPTPPQSIYDEEKERELFAYFSRRTIAHDCENFPIRWCDCVPDEAIEDHLNTWLSCAQSRAKSVGDPQ